MSKTNLSQIELMGYKYVIGARLKSMSKTRQEIHDKEYPKND